MAYDSNCKKCPYHSQEHLIVNQRTTRNSPPVEFENNNSDTLLVFQAPGDVEWRVGRAIQPTVKVGGTAGRRIELSWERVGKNRANFDIVNSVQCFPGNEGTRDLAPNGVAINSCSYRLKAILNTKEYRKIITFGDVANQMVNSLLEIGNELPVIIQAKHPNGGTSKGELDILW
ncbi:uracil-DNA glycosylase family protein [Pseudoalteromonas shioyasakiensis]|uniref:uracil-DNA glycosylase family protein n=1 Tax=Pseudoalteromonas shioyasakiensis TaxID=1190813 RepID=UPI002118B153|nr:uracil-DNA glycosylase family protein [Pseudoalteromonas shioyasakiensis]MCQ8876889.1 uracil-DNA glycosylase family protein [Pseudoalteromonas shioyasakiensis]